MPRALQNPEEVSPSWALARGCVCQGSAFVWRRVRKFVVGTGDFGKNKRVGGRRDDTAAPAAPRAGRVFGVVFPSRQSSPFTPWDARVAGGGGDKRGTPKVPSLYSQAEATVVTLVILVESSDQGWRFCRAKREELWTQMGSAWMGWLMVFWKASCCSCMRMRFACCRSASRSSAVCLLGERQPSGGPGGGKKLGQGWGHGHKPVPWPLQVLLVSPMH